MSQSEVNDQTREKFPVQTSISWTLLFLPPARVWSGLSKVLLGFFFGCCCYSGFASQSAVAQESSQVLLLKTCCTNPARVPPQTGFIEQNNEWIVLQFPPQLLDFCPAGRSGTWDWHLTGARNKTGASAWRTKIREVCTQQFWNGGVHVFERVGFPATLRICYIWDDQHVQVLSSVKGLHLYKLLI